MENSINGDQNFYSRRPLPQSPEQQHQQRSYEPPPLPQFDSRSPQSPPKLPFLTTSNLQASTSNGFGNDSNVNGGDPDEFYRTPSEYRGVQQLSTGYTDFTSGMAATVSEARPSQPSLRSNGNGTTPKHPSLPTVRNNLKPSYRSASAPIDERSPTNAKPTPALNGYGQSRQTSVKDLLKRFDQNNASSSSTTRKPTQRIVSKDNGNGGPGYVRERGGYQARVAGNPDMAGTQKAGVPTRDAPGKVKSPTVSRSTQRTRFVTEDQHSNNSQSSAARSPRPRNVATGSNSQASKSMINLSPTSPNQPAQVPSRKPLFGEVLPVGQGTPDIGYGIPHTATRRTSDSNLHPAWAHHRSQSDFDVSPSSPTAWYLGVTPALDDVDHNKSRSSFGHNRNHSDFADNRVNTMNGVNPDGFQPPTTTTLNPLETAKPSSRLPVASKRLSSPSGSSSAPSDRATSPLTNRPISNGKLRKAEPRPWSPAGRAATPTNTKSTSSRQSPRRKGKSLEKINVNNSSLKAYISAPLPKTSPPLRSSRPRQPVSSASTASSRQKAAERSGSPQQVRTGMRITRNEEPKPRKIVDVGPVDFAARRERIQRAYTKSIHETEQKEIRAANLRRLHERHARDSISADAQASDQGTEITLLDSQPETTANPPKSPEPLHISTSFPGNEDVQEHHVSTNLDSPTLGIPGTFVDEDETPQSAISTATGTTDIDNEPQTEAALLSRMTSAQRTVPRMISSHALPSYDMSPYEASFGMREEISPNDAGSIQIMLDATPVEITHSESTPTNEEFARDPHPPGAFKRDSEYQDYDQQPVFASTLTTASPKETTPGQSRTATPLKSGDETNSHPKDDDVLDAGPEHSQEHPAATYSVEEDPSSPLELVDPSKLEVLPSLTMNDVQEFLNTPVTDIDYDSSDGMGGAAASEQENYESHEPEQETQSSQMFRTSNQSAWTDYSVDTSDRYSQQFDFSNPHEAQDLEEKPTPPPKQLSPSPKPGVPPKPDNYSPQPSPRFAKEIPVQSSPIHHQLPPLTTGESLGIAFPDASSRLSSTSIHLWPDHAPPPPPIPYNQGDVLPAQSTRSPPPLSFYNKRPPSSVFHGSQNGTSRNTESRRASDDVYSSRPSTSTPRSSTQISVEDVSNGQTMGNDAVLETEAERKEAEKSKKRHFQRRMLMKELIETEAVYLKDMNVVEEIYKGTAEACPKLDSNDIKAIFRNTDEIVAFSTMFLDELKSAASSVYSPRGHRFKAKTANPLVATSPVVNDRISVTPTLIEESDEQKDRKTFIGANFGKHLQKMQTIYTDFLKNSELASTRLTALQADAAVQVWLDECNTVAKDLTAAWDLDALLVKPVQRITRYQLLLSQIFEHTAEDHPDYAALQVTCREMAGLLKNIDDLKRRIHMVGKIVGRKRKESDVRSGLAKAFGRRAEKIQASSANRPRDDDVYLKLHEKFGHDFLKLQIILRDFEFYTRQVATYVTDFLRYLSSIELMVRLSATPYPELESKWARFNMSMRDMGTVALEDHVTAVRKRVIEPIEQIIGAYGPPGLAMKKRSKRRLDYEKFLIAKSQGKKIDEKLSELVDQYEALNETLKMELPKLYAGSQKIGDICLVQFLGIQTEWYSIWKDKVRVVLEDSQVPKEISDIVDMFNRDYKYVQARAQELGIVNGTIADDGTKTRASSQSTMKDDDASSKSKSRPSNLSSRDRGLSTTSEKSPSLPTPDFAKRHSGQFIFSPLIASGTPGIGIGLPQFAYQTQSSTNGAHPRADSGSPAAPDTSFGSRPYALSQTRPSTSRSHTSDNGMTRVSTDYNPQHRRESGSTYNSASHHVDGPLSSGRPYSGVFHSAMPMPDGPEDSQRSSRASSRDRNISGGYNVLYLAASLFEFNISQTKSEAGYPYLTYQAGEIFDVIGEKGELWLAKNQDDSSDTVGWIWSKHFARLAND
ncbi:Dynamin-binding [Hyphodiscus hymeniophilus]|uniref:Dynamin-binding protein n=1 Tax=Hyphodiscus hymeniophilus TaxID=353542 RepID=A0A9P6VMI8_9HELO|nr:Dynamin-binding [Hyphodiscus hymeniophilus]